MISNKDLRVEDGNIIINGEKHPLDPAVDALIKRANTVQGKLSALDTRLDAIEALEKTASGNPISLTGAAEAYAMGLSMTIEATQSGSGDPSPTNVRPISGLTEGKVTRTGKNLLPVTLDGIKSANTSGTWSGNSYIINGVTFTVNTDSDLNVVSIDVSGTSNSSIDFYFYKGQMDIIDDSILSTEVIRAVGFDEYIGTIGITTGYDAAHIPSGTYTNCALYIAANIVMNNLLFKPMIRLATETDPTFEPYTATSATITFGQTVYGGSVDFKTGKVTVTHGNIASYNGESINEPWLSSMDKYVSGATPTTGAQVVYPLTTPTTLTLTPAELELLKGNNTISGNGVTINIDYIGR